VIRRRVLSFYLLREFSQYAGIGVLAAGILLSGENTMRRVHDYAGMDMSLGDLVHIVGAVLLLALTYVVPIAFVFGLLVAVARLSADSEITAMRTLGVSLAQIIGPFLLAGLVVGSGTWLLLSDVSPHAHREIMGLGARIAGRGGFIQPGHFVNVGGARTLFVDQRDGNHLKGVMISDRTDPARPFTVIAERGTFHFEPATTGARLELFSGDVHFEPVESEDGLYQRIAFRRLVYSFELGDDFATTFDRLLPKHMTSRELVGVIHEFERLGHAPDVRDKDEKSYKEELHYRAALSFAPALFALIGVPLGLRRSRGARSWGTLICIALIFGYYTLLTAGESAAGDGVLPAWIALWIPNLLLAVFAAVAFHQAQRSEI